MYCGFPYSFISMHIVTCCSSGFYLLQHATNKLPSSASIRRNKHVYLALALWNEYMIYLAQKLSYFTKMYMMLYKVRRI